MGDILLIVMIPAVFAFGYFAIDCLGKFFDENYCGEKEPQRSEKKSRKVRTEKKSGKSISKKVNSMLDSLPDRGGYKTTICKMFVHPHR